MTLFTRLARDLSGAGDPERLAVAAVHEGFFRTMGSAANVGRLFASDDPDGSGLGFVRVGLDCGFRLSALVTRDAWQRLSLKPGDEAWAIVKAATIRALPRR